MGFFHDKKFLVGFSLYQINRAIAIFIDLFHFRVRFKWTLMKCRVFSILKYFIYLISWPQWFANILDLVHCKQKALVGIPFQVKVLECVQSHAYSNRHVSNPLHFFARWINLSLHMYVFASVTLVFKNELIELCLYFYDFIVGNFNTVHLLRSHVVHMFFDFQQLFSFQINDVGEIIIEGHFLFVNVIALKMLAFL